jgi:hypothetical protein
LVHNWTVIDVPVSRTLTKRQNDDVLPGDEDDPEVDLAEEAKYLSWRDAVEIGIRNIAKLDTPQGAPSHTADYNRFYQDDRVDLDGPSEEGGEDDCGDNQDDTEDVDDDYIEMAETGFYPQQLLDVFGIPSSDEKFTRKEIYSKEQGGMAVEIQEPFATNGFLPNYKVIFALSNYLEHDHNPPDQRIPPNEVILQVWDELADAYDRKQATTGAAVVLQTRDELEWIVRTFVINKDTLKIMRLAAKRVAGTDYRAKLVRVTRVDNPEEFHALSGTPNCKGVYPTLADHDGGRFRGRRVTEMLVWRAGGLENYIAMKIE